MRPYLAALALLPLGAVPTAAQTADRYVMDRTEDGFVRMDSQTGAITLCRIETDRLVCEMDSPSGEVASPSDGSIDDRLAAIERRLDALESDPPNAEGLPSESEFNTALDYMRRFFETFRGIIRDFETDPAGAERT